MHHEHKFLQDALNHLEALGGDRLGLDDQLEVSIRSVIPVFQPKATTLVCTWSTMGLMPIENSLRGLNPQNCSQKAQEGSDGEGGSIHLLLCLPYIEDSCIYPRHFSRSNTITSEIGGSPSEALAAITGFARGEVSEEIRSSRPGSPEAS